MSSPSNEKPKLSSAEQSIPAEAHPDSKDFAISFQRIGHTVQITLTAADDYAAIELYDSLVGSMKRSGRINLNAAMAQKKRSA